MNHQHPPTIGASQVDFCEISGRVVGARNQSRQLADGAAARTMNPIQRTQLELFRVRRTVIAACDLGTKMKAYSPGRNLPSSNNNNSFLPGRNRPGNNHHSNSSETNWIHSNNLIISNESIPNVETWIVLGLIQRHRSFLI